MFLREWLDRVTFVNPGDVDGMAAAIERVMNRGYLAPVSSARQAAFRAAFGKEVQAHRLTEILEGIA